MPETVFVSQVETTDKLKATIAEQFKTGRYEEISRAIGLHSLLFDPQHTMNDQDKLYRIVLGMIKEKVHAEKGAGYGAWLTDFPAVLSGLVKSDRSGADLRSADVIASHEAGDGSFRSLDHFYFWALDDRRLTLGQIIRYITRSAAAHKG